MRRGGWAVALWVAALARVQAEEPAATPLLTLDFGRHHGVVTAVAWTPDSGEVVTCSQDKTVRIWDPRDGTVRATLRAPAGPGTAGMLYTLSISPDGRWLAVAGTAPANGVRVYDLPARRLERVLPSFASITGRVDFSPVGHLLAACGESNQVIVWDTATWRELGRPTLQQGVKALSFSPDGTRLACHDWSGTVSVVATDTLAVRPLTAVGPPTDVLTWARDGHRLVCAVAGGDIVAIDPESGSVTGRSPWKVTSPPTFCARPEGGFCAAYGGTLRNYNADLVVIQETHLRPVEAISSLALSPAGDALAAGTNGVRVYELSGTARWLRLSPVYWALWFAMARDGTGLSWGSTFAPKPASATAAEFRAADLALCPLASVGEEWCRAVRKRDGWSLVCAPTRVRLVRPDGTEAWSREPGCGAGVLLARGHTAFFPYWRAALTQFDEAGREVHHFTGSPGVERLVATADDRWLAATSNDGAMRIWSLTDPHSDVPPTLSLYPTADGDWVAWTEEGYYACSPAAEQWIGWQINRGDSEPQYFRAAQFRDRFYRPDVIRRVLKCGSVAKALQEADAERHTVTDPTLVASHLADFAPPSIVITAPADGAVVTESKVIVRARIHDPNSHKLALARVLVNGRAPWEGRFVFVPLRGPEEYAGPVELNPGENTISVTATNDAGAQTEPVSITVRYTAAEAAVTKPALYLLAVGVGQYTRPDYRLALAAKDAKDFAAAYQAQEGPLFRKVGVKLLTDRDATAGNILDGLDWLAKEVTQRDYAAVYLAGHGLPDAKGDFYFLPTDGDAEKLLRTAVSWQQLRGVLKNLPGKVLLFLDACHSGGAAGTRGAGRLDYINALRDAATDEVGVITLASCMPSEVSYERPEWGNGAFTKALVEGLGGKADLSGDGIVSVAELDAYVAERVKELTEGRQHPTTQRPTTIRNSLPVAAK